jgi:hypothetical protein
MNGYFYDIESLDNVFTLANFRDKDNVVEIYYLCDDDSLIPKQNFEQKTADHIREKNRNFTGGVEFYNLKNTNSIARLATIFGMSTAKYINNPNKQSDYPAKYRIVCDTDPEYDEELHPYLFGYNSYHYDTTMLTLFLYECIQSDGKITVTTAKSMRQYSDEMFENFNDDKKNMEDRLKFSYKNAAKPSLGFTGPDYQLRTFLIRKNMMMSGRHIDVARLNEKQSKVGLKRLLGQLGYQILESDKLRPGQNHIEDTKQLIDLIAYNVSDVVNLKKLFEHNVYTSGFLLKKQLLKTYPELIYDQLGDTYKPDIKPERVRKDRLIIDSSSAQFSTKALCPYGHLHDYDVVSFMYPSEEKSKKLGIPRVNVLEEAKKFFYKNFKQPELRAQFDVIYNYYKQIEGKNFNNGKNYLIDHGIDDPDALPDPEDLLMQMHPALKIHKLEQIPAPNTCITYFNADGSPSSCFVNFSTGGIHGAEYNKALYEKDIEKYQKVHDAWKAKVDILNRVMKMYPDPCEIKKNKGVTIEGIKYKPSDFLKSKATTEIAFYKDPPEEPKKPLLFKETKEGSGSYNINKRYTYTSADMVQHEDFVSYYPNMLRMMDAFFNVYLGYDRYGEIFDNKTRYGKMTKAKKYSKEKQSFYSIMKNGTKLILNSGSGAADANFESNIIMNNKIISMRIIGQLFTWRIGQAQTIAGAKIISTNTDGLYSAGLEETINNKVLEKESADIHVEIEPEPIYLISKDSNNRTEITMQNGVLGKVEGASGGSLACRKGPNPEKSLAHPAILDWALTEYLACAAMNYKRSGLDKPFVEELGMSILKSARKQFNDDVHTLLMFQNVIASSPGSQRFVFATIDEDLTQPIPLQHYNRCFIMKDNTQGTCHLQIASAKVITDAMLRKRRKNKDRKQQHDPIASAVLAVNGIKTSMLPVTKEATVTKIPGNEAEWYMLIENSDLHLMSEKRKNEILDNLDYDKYLGLLKHSFEKNWFNLTPEYEQALTDIKKAEKESAEVPVSLIDVIDDQNKKNKIKQTSSNTTADDTDNTDDTLEIVNVEDTSEIDEKGEERLKEEARIMHEAAMMVKENGEACLMAITNEIEKPIGFIDLDIPVANILTKLVKTDIAPDDIENAEHILLMSGIRKSDAHTVLVKLIKALTNTDIN